jgi:AcrR family transcriptional regulator
MPRLIEPEGRTETLVDAINFVLSRDGVAGLSLRVIARESRVSTSSMLHHFGSRERLLTVAAFRTGRARLRAIERGAVREGVRAFLPAPDDEEDLITARAWLAWCELWRSEQALTETIAGIREEERLLLARILDVGPASREVAAFGALVDGLTVALCAPIRPMSPAQAREILTCHVRRDPTRTERGAG